jgi:hypothetical protein
MLNRRQFEALHHAIDSRLDLLGLPHCHVVSAAYISQTCLQCGTRDARNAHNPNDLRMFTCVNCAYRADVDEVAACNVARKLIWLRLRRTEKAANVNEIERTSWETFARTFSLMEQTKQTKKAQQEVCGAEEGGTSHTGREPVDGEAS